MKDLITYGNDIDLYTTPHGMKENGKIKYINSFTFWYYDPLRKDNCFGLKEIEG